MKTSLPFRYIITSKNGKKYVIFDFKDDNGNRKRKWMKTDLREDCAKRALNLKVKEIVDVFYRDYLSGKVTKARHERIDRTVLNAEKLSKGETIAASRCRFVDFMSYWLETVQRKISRPSFMRGYAFADPTVLQ